MSGIVGTVPGMLFLVRLILVQGLVPRFFLFVVFVDVVTGGSIATL